MKEAILKKAKNKAENESQKKEETDQKMKDAITAKKAAGDSKPD